MGKSLSACLCGLLIFGPVNRAWPQASNDPVVTAQQTKGTPDERADQLLKQMTQEEKISLLNGAGFNTHPIQRLGIGAFYMSDGPQGVRNGPGTPTPRACAFPSGSSLASTWDVDLFAAYGKAIGLEDRARGTNFHLGPGVNICRVPVNGRNFEYFGEDPYLASIVAVNWVKNCAAQGSVPTIKHFAGNNQETNRNSVSAVIDERTLNEIYLPAFKKAVLAGGNIAVMCSYNRLNGSYAGNSDWLLNQTLKNRWGFKGLVMSDWGASHAVSDLAHGLDLEMPRGVYLSAQNIPDALSAGAIKQSDIDGAVHRILRTEAAAGWFDEGWQQKNPSLPMDSPDSVKTALEVAQSSIVLLKNDRSALPLDRNKVKTIVVVGPNASAPEGTVPANIGGGGSGLVTPFAEHIPDADYLQGITKIAGENVKVIYLPMPDDTNQGIYDLLANAQTVDGKPGLTLNVEVTGDGEPVKIEPTVQTSINLNWTAGQLPLGVPAGRDATFTWTGALTAPADGDWEIGAVGSPSVTIGDQVASEPDGAVIHLEKDKPTPIKIQFHATARVAGRGGRGGGGGGNRGGGPRGRGGVLATQGGNTLRVGFQSPAIPDLSAVKTADAAIVCVGFNRVLELEGRDRPFELPGLQQYLVNAVAAMNPRTIVVNNSGAGVGMTNWKDSPAAILQAWYLGQEGGLAIGSALFGDYNPSGRLCSTFDRKFEDNPAFAYYPGKTEPGMDYPTEPYTEGIFYGYRGYDKAKKDPLYPFGYGLSYTTFDLSNMKIDASGEDVKVSLDVKNTGPRAGAEVVQIYVGEQDCPIPRPLRELKGFAKVPLDPGQSKRVEITLPRDSFAYWSPEKKDWTFDAGNSFTIDAGVSERDIKQSGTIRIR